MSAAIGDFVELRARSAFSFLEGASNPEDMVERAVELGHETLALADRDGVYGLPRFHQAAQSSGLRPIVGSEVAVRGDASRAGPEGHVRLLVESRRGWKRLCRLLTAGHATAPKGETRVDWRLLEEFAGDWVALVRGDAALTPGFLDRALGVFGAERLRVDVSRHREREAERAARRAADLAGAHAVEVVASGDARCARPETRRLLDALTCLRWKTTLDGAGRRLLPNGERCLQSPAEIGARFADRPEWLRGTRAVAERCEFTLEDLGYRFPEFPVPRGETQPSYLRALTFMGARERYGVPLPRRVRSQLEKELALIEKLELAGYFLIVHDLVRFAVAEDMLAQGRGSAANSAVCYALGITAVDPVGMELLFERFLSEERGEWPDIDIDLPSGDQREKVIQYAFTRYGAAGAAMTANVITYRSRMAIREMAKVLGFEPDTTDRLSKLLSSLEHRDDLDELSGTLREAGVDPTAPRIGLLLDLVEQVRGLPRHLSQHSGGVVIAAGRLDEVVPIEPASMADRRVVQWDKEDCADLGIIKIDLLGLGMLQALEETIPLVREHEGVEIDLAHLPPDDPETYAMIQRADTVGVFQIESRAQMATLPRMRPERFYDLVVEIAIIRPGPIVGQMVHPYLNRRNGREEVVYPHPSLEPILERTLGIPLFQEQLLRIAMVAAGFSGGEAEELRRAMGFKRSVERMDRIEERLRDGMKRRGIDASARDTIVKHIGSFALYGFPESHSASFALIAYASAYLKRHHPAAFLAGLLNAWPMGFYNPATLVKDAQRHGVTVRPVDVAHSRWKCTLESGNAPLEDGPPPPKPCAGRARAPARRPPPAVRIGLRYVDGLRSETGARIDRERARQPFRDLADLVRRVPFKGAELDHLAELGALGSLAGASPKRRSALWQVSGIERDRHSLFAGRQRGAESGSPLEELTPLEATLTDYRLAGLTTGPQLLAHLRKDLDARGVLSAEQLRRAPDGHWVRTAGHVIVRQRPGSAKGFCFLTLEDETGTSNAVLTPDQFRKFRAPLHTSAVVEIAGPVQKVDGVVHVKVRELVSLSARNALPESHDYH
ncbi:MAG: error-prone DNA polymerase [Myxococcota bacterium]